MDAEGRRHVGGLPDDIGAAIVGEPFEPVWDLVGLEAMPALASADQTIVFRLHASTQRQCAPPRLCSRGSRGDQNSSACWSAGPTTQGARLRTPRSTPPKSATGSRNASINLGGARTRSLDGLAAAVGISNCICRYDGIARFNSLVETASLGDYVQCFRDAQQGKPSRSPTTCAALALKDAHRSVVLPASARRDNPFSCHWKAKRFGFAKAHFPVIPFGKVRPLV